MSLDIRAINTLFRWNILDSLATSILLIAHHLCVRTFGGPQFHGELSVVFSLIYLSINISVAGLDTVLALVWQQAHTSQKSLRLLMRQILGQQVTIYFVAIVIGIFVVWYRPDIVYTITSLLPLWVFITAITIEIAKKCLKSFVFFSQGPQLPAAVEVIGFVAYLISIWSFYVLCGYSLVASILVMSLVSIAQASFFLVIARQWYNQLAVSDNLSERSLQPLSTSRVSFIRYSTAFNHIVAQIFTSNFIVPCIAQWCSWSLVSIAKIVSTCAHVVIKVIQKSIGSTALLAHAHHKGTFPMFSLVHLLHSFLGLCIGLLILSTPPLLFATCSLQWTHIALITLLFVILALSEGLYTLYDRVLTLEHHSAPLVGISGITLFLIVFLVPLITAHDAMFIAVLILVRIIMLIALLSYVLWFYSQKGTLTTASRSEFVSAIIFLAIALMGLMYLLI